MNRIFQWLGHPVVDSGLARCDVPLYRVLLRLLMKKDCTTISGFLVDIGTKGVFGKGCD